MHLDFMYFRAAGVTFENDDGSSRQRYISKLYEGQQLFLVPYEYEGSPAYHITDCYDHCIGNVPSVYVNDIHTHLAAGHKLDCSVSELLGYDEDGHRIEDYNLGVEVYVGIYDDQPEPDVTVDPVEPIQPETIEPVPETKQKRKTGRIMIAFGIICAINAIAILNPMTAILAVIFLFFGIRRYKNYKNQK